MSHWPWRSVTEAHAAAVAALRDRIFVLVATHGGIAQSVDVARQLGVATRCMRPLLAGDPRFSFVVQSGPSPETDGRRHVRLFIEVKGWESVKPEAEVFDQPIFRTQPPDIKKGTS